VTTKDDEGLIPVKYQFIVTGCISRTPLSWWMMDDHCLSIGHPHGDGRRKTSLIETAKLFFPFSLLAIFSFISVPILDVFARL